MAGIAAALDGELSIAHRDDDAILYCDRPPIRWQHRDTRGLCWSEGVRRDERVTSWQDAARSLAACGLVVDDNGAHLHTSVAGIAPIYYREVGGATYFASRIHPLVAAFEQRVSIDWEAWASIFLITAPIGERTPFAEVRRLAPYTVLSHPSGQRPRIEEHDWPWAHPDGAASPEIMVEALREAIATLPESPVTCLLSGGWDSRLLLALLAEREELDLSALTMRRSEGGHDEEAYARAVAAALSVPLSEVEGADWTPWRETTEIAARTDYQTTHHGWFMALVRGVGGRPGVVADGLGGDVFLDAKPLEEKMLDSLSWDDCTQMVWTKATTYPYVTQVLSDRLAAAFTAIARRQWMEQARTFAEHPACLSLAIYRTRIVRGISLAPIAVIGADAETLTPFTDDRVARAALMLPMRGKVRSDTYRRLFELVNPAVGDLPSTHDQAPTGWSAALEPEPGADAVGGCLECLERSPLRAEIDPALLGSGEALPRLITARFRSSHVLRALNLLSLWQARYADKLNDIDARDVLA